MSKRGSRGLTVSERRGDRTLAELARDRGPDLFAYGYLLTGDRAAAQDLVQDAIVKVFARMRTGFTPDVAEAYVRRTMLTLYVDAYRRRKTWNTVAHLVSAAESSADETAADRVDLRVALRDLSPQERVCVVLRFYEDLTVPETADRTGLAPGTVKRYLSNAMDRLQARLGPLAGLEEDGIPVTPTPPTRVSTRTTGSRS
jgi:RNA polymerase sigma factor (sigma-70 family)